jgi:dTDP-glucose 4,6-dehydratase
MNRTNMLVTGGGGFIGSSFAAMNVARGNKVIVLDIMTYAGHKQNLEWIKPQEDIELIIGNINDYSRVLDILKKWEIDVIINIAAETHVDNSILSPKVFIDTNIVGTYQLLEAALAYYKTLKGEKADKFRYIQISTDEVYGSLKEYDPKFTETNTYLPNSPYSASKAAGDHLVRAWHKTYGLPTITTNCSNNYGPRQHPEKLIPKLITSALLNQPLPIYGTGQNIRDWIYVEDHCRGINLAIEKGIVGETYCFSGRNELSNIALANIVCEVLDELTPLNGKTYASLIKFVPDRAGHDFRYAIDDSKAQRLLGFEPSYNFEDGIRSTILWYLENKDWCEQVRHCS